MFTQFLLYLFIGVSTFVASLLFLQGLVGRGALRVMRRLFRKRPPSVFLRPYHPTKP